MGHQSPLTWHNDASRVLRPDAATAGGVAAVEWWCGGAGGGVVYCYCWRGGGGGVVLFCWCWWWSGILLLLEGSRRWSGGVLVLVVEWYIATAEVVAAVE